MQNMSSRDIILKALCLHHGLMCSRAGAAGDDCGGQIRLRDRRADAAEAAGRCVYVLVGGWVLVDGC